MLERLEYFSDWHQAERAIALCLRFKRMLQQLCIKRPQRVSILDLSQYKPVSVNEPQDAEFAIIKIAQADSFHYELHTLKTCKVYGAPSDRESVSDRHTSLKGKSDLRPLDPFLDSAGVIRVGERIQNAKVSYAVKHPMVLPKRGHVTEMLVRQIRSVRNVLVTLLHLHGQQFDDESLRTFLYESDAIVNSRPLTVDNINDPLSVTPLTSNQLLTMKTKVILPPPGNFQKRSLYSHKHWRRTQYLVNEFWARRRTEYIQNLQV